MRRILALVAVVALVASLIAVATGLGLMKGFSGAIADGASSVPPGRATPVGIAHAAAGHLTAGLVAVLAAIAFVFGLHGLLVTGRRGRLGPMVLFLLAPALMACAIATDLSGFAHWRDVRLGRLRPETFDAFIDWHGLLLTALLLGGLSVFVAIAWVMQARDEEEEEAGRDRA